MPIFEFKCLDCDEYLEILVMNKKDEVELACPHCGSCNLERILSTTSHTVTGGGPGRPASSGASTQTRNCSSGSCTTYTIPGPA
ncbi:MAG: zinc ribbon domain-containing protein [Desulfosarcina sp.]|nr:zinc ribbon domain-containing protein [Desulfosarcina sp.]MBC2743219.1 zinc ribbon domain-containing protein [Desulfosarcina sp.]MBC2766130.1 zinc ribbon domain-containing protein [Desulfosarcina sp.]